MRAVKGGTTSSPRAVRLTWGTLACTVISDGFIDAGTLADTLADAGTRLPPPFDLTTRVTLDINLLVVETDGVRILFDAGAGSDRQLGRAMFGPSVGHAPQALRSVGIDPATVDLVALTHAHPDHAWGLIDSYDQPCFPNARIVIGNAELDHWLGDRLPQPAEDGELARLVKSGAQRSLRAYGDRIIGVEDGDALAPAVIAHESPGHSPGHMTYEIACGDERLVCWGDICHHPVLLSDPELNFTFDHDPAAAVQSRVDLLATLSEREIDVVAYHLPFPGMGRVIGSRDRGYMWQPSAGRQLRYAL